MGSLALLDEADDFFLPQEEHSLPHPSSSSGWSSDSTRSPIKDVKTHPSLARLYTYYKPVQVTQVSRTD